MAKNTDEKVSHSFNVCTTQILIRNA